MAQRVYSVARKRKHRRPDIEPPENDDGIDASPNKRTFEATSPSSGRTFEDGVGSAVYQTPPTNVQSPSSSSAITFDEGVDSTGYQTPPTNIQSPAPSSVYGSGEEQSDLSDNDDQGVERSFLPDHLVKVLTRRFSIIKDDLLEPDEPADYLFQEGIISEQYRERITEAKSRRIKADILVKAIIYSDKIAEVQTIYSVLKALSMKQNRLIWEGFLDKPEPLKEKTTIRLTEDEMRDRLNANIGHLRKVEAHEIIDYLVVIKALSFLEHDSFSLIDHMPTRMDSLIKFIERDIKTNFPCFVNALGEIPKYKTLQKKLVKQSIIRPAKLHVVTNLSGKSRLSCRPSASFAWGNDRTTRLKYHLGDETEEKMIIDNYNDSPSVSIQEEAMEIGLDINDITFACIQMSMSHLSRYSQLRFLQRCKTSPSFVGNWFHCLLPERSIQKLKKAETYDVSFEIQMQLPMRSEVVCCCRLTKDAITRHFSYIEKEMKSADIVIESFSTFNALSRQIRKNMKLILRMTDGKTDAFLRQVLDRDMPDFGFCLFEKLLRCTEQSDILKYVLEKEGTKTESKRITTSTIMKNFDFLLDELDPTPFEKSIRIFLEEDETTNITVDDLVDKMLSEERRKDRCRLFLHLLIKKGQKGTDWLISELKKANTRSTVVEVLEDSCDNEDKFGDDDLLKESVLVLYTEIVEEIEPRLLRATLVDDESAIASNVYTDICRHRARNVRAVWLLKHVFQSGPKTIRSFVDALLLNGYEHIVCMIKQDMAEYKECPKLSEDIQDNRTTVCLKGNIDLQFTKSEKSHDGMLLDKILQIDCKPMNKEAFTKTWIEEVCLEKGIPYLNPETNRNQFKVLDKKTVASLMHRFKPNQSPCPSLSMSSGSSDLLKRRFEEVLEHASSASQSNLYSECSPISSIFSDDVDKEELHTCFDSEEESSDLNDIDRLSMKTHPLDTESQDTSLLEQIDRDINVQESCDSNRVAPSSELSEHVNGKLAPNANRRMLLEHRHTINDYITNIWDFFQSTFLRRK